MAKWELRRGRRWGSEHIRFEHSLAMAKTIANSDIIANGNVGRITLIDRDKCVIYYDIHEEMT